ncbi:hypothetical protein Vadar_017563 [Vaccinium darrowii]|uniref:Uncharacterized protein n=1 Tax=Vaccinium darrowii TaxID=229202 RepID=A0ACB7Y7P6_9ERIC|nr:hypothetical protein Vadar_017563 [Vaccinium darrowii]
MAIKTQDTTIAVQSFLSLALHAIRLPSRRFIFLSSAGIIWVDLLHMRGSNHPKSSHSFLGQEMNLRPGFAAIQEVWMIRLPPQEWQRLSSVHLKLLDLALVVDKQEAIFLEQRLRGYMLCT